MANTGYTPINANKNTDDAEHQKQKEIYAADPNTNAAYTAEELKKQMEAAGVDTSGMDTYSQMGGYTQNQSEAISGGGTGEKTAGYKDGSYYSYPGVDRPVKEGDSGADEHFLSDSEYAYVQHCKQMYAQAQTPEEKAYWHAEAEKTRARHDYAGGTDGSGYHTLGALGAAGSTGSFGVGGVGGSGGSSASAGNGNMQALLDAWQQAALQQSNAQTDYAVQQAVAQLERALADAQPQFKEQAETVDLNARQAMDNSALYAEMRGDKGGIGQEQYNSIQNTQAQNHLSVQQAQTKLATDTQRQIADLRAQGEFEKADAALQITQQYLAQLISLEQWAAEYNLSVQQFEASLQQWEAEYNMAMQQLQISQNQWQAEFDAAQSQWQQQFDYGKQSDMASMGWALLEAGVPLSQEQLDAMGISSEQATKILWQQQLAAAGTPKTEWQKMTPDQIYQALYAAGYTDKQPESIENFLRAYGVSNPGDYAAAYVNEQYGALHKKALTDNSGWGEGYGTNQTYSQGGNVQASEWDRHKSSIRTYLESGNFEAVTRALDDMSAINRWSEGQWLEIKDMLDRYGYFTR